MPTFTAPASTAVDFALETFTAPASTAVDFELGSVTPPVGPVRKAQAQGRPRRLQCPRQRAEGVAANVAVDRHLQLVQHVENASMGTASAQHRRPQGQVTVARLKL
jgi:hypothetical protein